MREANESLSHTKWNCKYHIVFVPQVSSSAHLRQIQSKYRKNHTGLMYVMKLHQKTMMKKQQNIPQLLPFKNYSLIQHLVMQNVKEDILVSLKLNHVVVMQRQWRSSNQYKIINFVECYDDGALWLLVQLWSTARIFLAGTLIL